jgi:four helix bundle protein
MIPKGASAHGGHLLSAMCFLARREAWRKRRYPAVFKNKVTDSMQEASETQCWLEFSLACGYIEQGTFNELDDEYEQIIAMLNSMELNADKFCF